MHTALILLRKDGLPCVFYGDYFGIGGEEAIEGKKEAIDPLVFARYHKAYGEQEDYFDDPHTIGWVRRGLTEIRFQAVLLLFPIQMRAKTNVCRQERAGEEWVDLTRTETKKFPLKRMVLQHSL